ncbi:glycosyltransferase [Phragmitibacter flavus]|uniref:Glycosyltransferase n=1 Tax=Phragmitibacter flavus TaxID=2576071 RepID=A0A5R8K9K0_9BACT|nr:galactosyltransferase-related protein [Phragmitibacter flavus]TLD68983.1 glycosyltransferase [Phragmitibacter flavus]
MQLRIDQLPAWIINLNRSQDRWSRCYRSLSGVFRKDHLHRVTAVDGLDFLEVGPDSIKVWKTEILQGLQKEGLLLKDQVLDPVRVALCLSHQRALHAFLESGESWGIIFEDDACVGESMAMVMQQGGVIEPPDDAEVLFLHDRVKSRKLDPLMEGSVNARKGLKWREVRGGIGLEAYAVSRVGARKMLASWKPVALECDLQLMTFVAGYVETKQSARLRGILGKESLSGNAIIKAYCPNRPLFQADPQVMSVKMETIHRAALAVGNSGVRPDGAMASSGGEQAIKWEAFGYPLKKRLEARGSMSVAASAPTSKRRWKDAPVIGEAVGGPKPKFSFCVTCMGRLDHLMETLPVNLEVIRRFGDSEIVLLDYHSPDGLGDYVLDHFKSAMQSGLLRLAATEMPDKFRMAHAKNVCHKQGRGEFLINLDADHFLNEGYMRELSKATEVGKADVCTFVYDKQVYGGGFGRVVIRRELFYRLGGYDEDHHGYGHEDIDLVERAKRVGGRLVKLASHTAEFIQHGDERRGLTEKDRGTEAAKWESFFKAKWERGEWVANQDRPWGVVDDLGVRPGNGQLTVVLTNYRRTANMGKILDSIPEDAEVVVLDNAPPGFELPVELVRRTSWYLKSDGNDLVLRWMLAARSKTEFFCVQDDDLLIKNWEPYLDQAAEVDTLVGPFGVDLNLREPGRCYSGGSHSIQSRECDVIKGRAVFGRVKELRRVLSLTQIGQVGMNNDDVFISSLFKAKHHVVEVEDNIVELADNDAISKRRRHLDSRDVSAMKFFLERDAQSQYENWGEDASIGTRGVVLCASPQYAEMASRAMESLKRSNPLMPIYCHPAEEGFASRVAKLSMDLWSPFQDTLFIDCDTLVCEDLEPVFKLLESAPLYMAKETPKYTTLGSVANAGWIEREAGSGYAQLLRKLPGQTPIWNSGVILFRKGEGVHRFFAAWRRRWELRGSATLDQLPLAELVIENGPPAELPPYWHCQVSSQNPKSEIPRAAVYHFMGGDKGQSYRRWEMARVRMLAMMGRLNGKH